MPTPSDPSCSSLLYPLVRIIRWWGRYHFSFRTPYPRGRQTTEKPVKYQMLSARGGAGLKPSLLPRPAAPDRL